MTTRVKNILFIMADQLRWDYLSCYGHPTLDTPNIDRLAEMGVRFDRAYVQSPVCGPSRASYYTGRTVFSHGATWNRVPLPIGEMTIGDYLRPLGIQTAVVGKTHMMPDRDGMTRFGLTEQTEIGIQVSQPGFDPYERDDGLHPDELLRRKGGKLRYNDWLRQQGYDSENPWNEFANSAEGPDGEVLSAWELRHSALPARVAREHSETAYMTMRGIEFMQEMGDQPWLLHLSYIKPHWPYIAPAPYHSLYGPNSFLPPCRSNSEREDPNPVFSAFMGMQVSKTFSEDEVRETVLTGYMGLIKEIDDHVGRVLDYLEASGCMDDTMIVFTSDHGDYLGDHWMGEKELFHEQSVRVPLIIYHPDNRAETTRGSVNGDFVEAIDLVPTFIDATGAEPPSHRLEGRTIQPLLFGERQESARDHVFSEIDYAFYAARDTLNVGPADARGYMIRTDHWKYVHFKGFPPQLFDLKNDPEEFEDLGRTSGYEQVREELKEILFGRLLDRKNRVTMTDQEVLDMRLDESKAGIVIGRW